MARRENRPAEDPPRPAPRPLAPRIPVATPKKSTPTVKILIQTDPSDLGPHTLIERLRQNFAERASSVMVSLAIHLVAFMLLGLIVYQTSEGLEASDGIIATWLTPDDIAEREQRMAQAVQAVEIETHGPSSPSRARR